jgi:hypothetical protein
LPRGVLGGAENADARTATTCCPGRHVSPSSVVVYFLRGPLRPRPSASRTGPFTDEMRSVNAAYAVPVDVRTGPWEVGSPSLGPPSEPCRKMDA